MAENTGEIAVGGGILALAGAFAIYVAAATGGSGGGTDRYELKAAFRSAQGISAGAPVRMAGVQVGRINTLRLNPETFRAVASVSVRDDIELPSDSSIEIASDGLLGGNYVEIVPGGMPDTLRPGDQFVYTQGAVSLLELLSKFVGSGAGEDGGTDR